MALISGKGKCFGTTPLFRPEDGIVVRSPSETGSGWWAGAPGASYDPESNIFYLVYRQRQPRELGRGVECRIAASDNGVVFSDIWALPKTSFDAVSLERCSLLRGFDRKWRLYVSYVSPTDNKWRIAMMEADEPDRFDAAHLDVIMTAESTGTEGIKDPNVFVIGPMYYMLASYAAPMPGLAEEQQSARHATGDIYNTGLTRSRTAAAISSDGRSFRWIGDISPTVGAGRIGAEAEDGTEGTRSPWDGYCKRIGALLPIETGGYLAFYDGSASVSENYEEKTGLAVTFDLQNYRSLSSDGPSLISPFATGSLRYVDVLSVGRELFYYYEMACADGSHDLRVSVLER